MSLDDMKPGKIWYREPDDPLPHILPQRYVSESVTSEIQLRAKVEAIKMGLKLRDAGQGAEEVIEHILHEERELVETYTAQYLIEHGTPAAEDYRSHMQVGLLYGMSIVQQKQLAVQMAASLKTPNSLIDAVKGVKALKTIKFRRRPFKNEDPS